MHIKPPSVLTARDEVGCVPAAVPCSPYHRPATREGRLGIPVLILWFPTASTMLSRFSIGGLATHPSWVFFSALFMFSGDLSWQHLYEEPRAYLTLFSCSAQTCRTAARPIASQRVGTNDSHL